jgi:hypothetical protein
VEEGILPAVARAREAGDAIEDEGERGTGGPEERGVVGEKTGSCGLGRVSLTFPLF